MDSGTYEKTIYGFHNEDSSIRKKILVIEDNDFLRENTAEILRMANYHVITASNGREGVEMAFKENPDLILCDIVMPILDGYGVLHMLQKDTVLRNKPFIFITVKSDRVDFRKAMELGADDYIYKPFTGTELLNSVEKRLNKIESLKEKIDNELKVRNEISKTDLFKELVSDRRISKYKKKQLIYAEGNRPACLYFIKKGKVKTYKTNEEGKQLIMDLYKEGEFLGYIGLLENANYQESAEAMTETELAIIPQEDFDELINTSHEVSKKFIQILARNIVEKENQLLGIAYNSLQKKVATALLTLYDKYNIKRNDVFSISISRDNLASIAGTATESLIRTLTYFKNLKLIDIKEGSITILNERKLRRYLD
ncbi:MAG: response regulator [Bacteroidota bacterium]|nr:response regulator [Bacteroidota bacterium]